MEKISINTIVTTTEVASVLGLSVRRVQQLIQDGVITTVSRGKMRLSEAVQQYIASIQKPITDEKEDEASKTKSEAILKKAKATIASLDAQERLGKMHRSEDVAAMTEDLIFSIRSALMALPGRLAVDVAEVTDTAQASEIIRAEVYQVMEELSQYRYDPAKYQERVRDRLRLEALDDEEE